jgi:FkbM family methyltransferase
MLDYDVQYSDLLTFCPQWYDIFVERSLAFDAAVPNPRILDCGANVGLSALFYKRQYPQARITAYEADPAIAAQLTRNLRVNGAADVDVVASAVWIEEGVVTFAAQGADAGTLARFAHQMEQTSIQVPSCRLADVVAQETIDLLKLDIEGAELDVLRDIAPHLRNVRAIQLGRDGARTAAACGAADDSDHRRVQEPIARVTHLPWLDRANGDRPFPQWAESLVAAVCGGRVAMTAPQVTYVMPDKTGGVMTIIDNLLRFRRRTIPL